MKDRNPGMGSKLKWKKRPMLLLGGFMLLCFIYVIRNCGNSIVEEEKTPINLKQLFLTSIGLCKSAGQVVRNIYESKKYDVASKGLSKEGKQNLLTTADMESHRLLMHGFHKSFPALSVVSEERESDQLPQTADDNANGKTPVELDEELDNLIVHVDETKLISQTYFLTELHAGGAEQSATREANAAESESESESEAEPEREREQVAADFDAGESPLEFASFAYEKVLDDQITIWVDPLDATQEYTEGLHQYVTVMVCVAVRGEPIMGVVYAPFDDTMYFAWNGHAVSNNLRPALQRQKKTADSGSSFVVSRSHAGLVEQVLNVSVHPSRIEKAGGSGYKSLHVLLDRADAYTHVTEVHKWDLCAPNALVSAVGGRFTTLLDQQINYATPVAEGEEDVLDGLLVSVGFDQSLHSSVAARIHRTLLQLRKPTAVPKAL